jgi:hypothetical protein
MAFAWVDPMPCIDAADHSTILPAVRAPAGALLVARQGRSGSAVVAGMKRHCGRDPWLEMVSLMGYGAGGFDVRPSEGHRLPTSLKNAVFETAGRDLIASSSGGCFSLAGQPADERFRSGCQDRALVALSACRNRSLSSHDSQAKTHQFAFRMSVAAFRKNQRLPFCCAV